MAGFGRHNSVNLSSDEMNELGVTPLPEDGDVEENSTNSRPTMDVILPETSNASPEGTPRGRHLKCRSCDSTFSNKASLNRHKRKHEGHLLNCNICPRVFYNTGDLAQHKLASHQGVTLKYDNCEKEYTTMLGLKRHQQIYTGKFKHTCTCNVCGKGFAYSQLYMDHINIHHGVKPHICDLCKQKFSRKCDYQFHKTICGMPSERVECTVCRKKFKTKRYLIDHMHMHISPSKYQCSHCGKTYSHKGSLKNHVKRAHNTSR